MTTNLSPRFTDSSVPVYDFVYTRVNLVIPKAIFIFSLDILSPKEERGCVQCVLAAKRAGINYLVHESEKSRSWKVERMHDVADCKEWDCWVYF